jgi:hypothetical protein
MKNINIKILKEIVGSDYTILKRKLTIYNITNNTDYKLSDLGITEYENKSTNEVDFYFYGTKMDDSFSKKSFFGCVGNWRRANIWLDKRLENAVCVPKPEFDTDIWETIHDASVNPTEKIAENIYTKNSVNMRISNKLLNEFVEKNIVYNAVEASLICRQYLVDRFGDTFFKYESIKKGE